MRLFKTFTPAAGIIGLWLVAFPGPAQTGTWTTLTNPAPNNIFVMLLLPDGTVMAGDGNIGNAWYRLTPDRHGSYANGTWTTLAPMVDTRNAYASDVLTNGQVFVAGGEYGTGTASAEVYDPLLNNWSFCPGTGQRFADSISVVIANGDVLVAPVEPNPSGARTLAYSPSSNAWNPSVPMVRGSSQGEASWVKLPDNSILTIDTFSTNSERYIPSLNQWVNDANVPVSLYDPYGFELGPAFLLPNGKAIFFGSLPHTAIYTPSGSASPGTWVAGPDYPNNQGMPDAAGAMMVNGRVLLATSLTPNPTNHFQSPTSFYEYDPVANSFTQVNGLTLNQPAYYTRMLALPDGSVILYSENDTHLYIYHPGGSPLAAGQPKIASITTNSYASYHLAGTLLNGISQGASYGDDSQMDSNYPLVRMTNGVTGDVYYARTYNWNSTGVMTGTNEVSTEFMIPPNVPAGNYSLVVVANGNSSAAVPFTWTPDALRIGPLTGFAAAGPTNGPFIPSSAVYSLTNTGASALNWSAAGTASWLTVSPGNGSLAPGGSSSSVTVSVNSGAAALAIGTYTATVSFSNAASGAVQSLPYRLQVNPEPLNAGFETGSTAFWTLSGDPGMSKAVPYLGFVHSGYYGAELGENNSGSLGYLSQSVATVPGQAYLLSFWLANPQGTGSNRFVASWNGINLFAATNMPTFTYTNLQFTVSATSSNTALQFGFINPSFFGVDDVSLTSIQGSPTPPVITVQPQSQTVPSGSTVDFSVEATGTAPLSYQWTYAANGGTNLSFEAVNLAYTTNGATAAVQNDTHFPGGHWLALNATKAGPYIQYTLPNLPAGTYQLQMTWKGNNNRGILRLSVDGTTLGANLDQYSAGQTYPTTTFGNVTLSAGNHLVRLTVTGKNSASSGYGLSTYSFTLIPNPVNPVNLAGATNELLILTNVQPAQAGAYAVKVTNPYGSVTSSNAVLAVQAVAPTITSQPAGQTVVSGSTVSFSVTVVGSSPLSYQWTFKGTNLSGATGASLTLVNVQPAQAGAYAVKVMNPYGSITSSNAVLAVQTVAPMITSQPASQTVVSGGVASFSVTATGSLPLSYQWIFNGTNLSGATGASLTLVNVQPAQAGAYAVKVTNPYGSVTSSNAMLSVIGSALLHGFSGTASGGYPHAGLVLSGGMLYGAATGGGSGNAGFLFKIGTNGTGYSVIYNFSAPSMDTNQIGTNFDGAAPQATLIVSGGELYGTASAGGFGYGTVFKVGTNGTGFTTLYMFAGGDDGNLPGGLVLSGGTLYGSTAFGGASHAGTLYSIDTNGAGYATIYTFTGTGDGDSPTGPLTVSGSTLYGAASLGGSLGNGTLFAIQTNGAGFTTIYTFTRGSDGASPMGPLAMSGSTLYGTASAGGTAGDGVVFSIQTDGNGFTTLHSFSGVDGDQPQAGVALYGSTLYGTTVVGGTGDDGVVFSVQTDGTAFAAIHSFSALVLFTNSDGATPYSGVVLSGSTLYGTAAMGGSEGDGTMFAVRTDGTGFALYHDFINRGDGSGPSRALILSGGTLYGLTQAGGDFGLGAVYSIATNGTGYTTLYSFTGGNDGVYPAGPLAVSGGTLYGVTASGGILGNGTVFSLSTNGTGFTTLHNFAQSEANSPAAGLVRSGGTLYGTSQAGGSSFNGTVFSLGTNGTGFKTLYSFTGGNDGSGPLDAVVSGGMIYGTATGGGASGYGTVYSLRTNGTGFKTLYAFTGGNDGNLPHGPVLSGRTLYGVTSGGGSLGFGTVFSLSTNGSGFTTLYAFTGGSDGADPSAGLVVSNGTLYGTASIGGTFGDGTVFSLSTNGSRFGTLLSFNGYIGSSPTAQLLLSGNQLFGTAGGGPFNDGTVFVVTLPTGMGANVQPLFSAGTPPEPGLGVLSPGNTPAQPAGVTVTGHVKNSAITWTPGLTLAQAIMAANYTGADNPAEIVITRKGELAVVNVQDLLNGADVPLEPGDTIEIQSP